MQITESSTYVNLDIYARNVENKQKVEVNEKKSAGDTLRKDEVVLSPTANKLSEARRNISNIADIREQKIARIKMQIENGTYQVNPKKIATGLLMETLLNDIV